MVGVVRLRAAYEALPKEYKRQRFLAPSSRSCDTPDGMSGVNPCVRFSSVGTAELPPQDGSGVGFAQRQAARGVGLMSDPSSNQNCSAVVSTGHKRGAGLPFLLILRGSLAACLLPMTVCV